MASDSREEGSVPVEVPADLDEWLQNHAAEIGVDRADLLVQLAAAYRAADAPDGELDVAAVFGDDIGEHLDVDEAIAATLETRGEDLLADPVAEAVERQLADRLADEVEAAVEQHLPTITDAVEGRIEDRSTAHLEDRIDALEGEFQEKIVDVRERVIQVKTEADEKAPADHDHDAFERIDALDERLQSLAETVEDLGGTVEDLEGTLETVQEDVTAGRAEATEGDDFREDVDERLADVEDKLNRVAWVVSDLKDETGGRSANEQAVARIKRAAAQEGVQAADCERCGESVDVALLTDPECPHCNAAVSDVRPTGGIFRTKATLVAASQLESGEE